MPQLFIKQVLFTGVEGFTTEEDQDMLGRIEKQLKRRFVIGSQVSEHAVLQDFLKQVGRNVWLANQVYGYFCIRQLGAEKREHPEWFSEVVNLLSEY